MCPLLSGWCRPNLRAAWLGDEAANQR